MLPDCAVKRSNHYTIETRHWKRWYTTCEKCQMQDTLVHAHKRAFNDVCNLVTSQNKWNTESDVEGDVDSGSDND